MSNGRHGIARDLKGNYGMATNNWWYSTGTFELYDSRVCRLDIHSRDYSNWLYQCGMGMEDISEYNKQGV